MSHTPVPAAHNACVLRTIAGFLDAEDTARLAAVCRTTREAVGDLVEPKRQAEIMEAVHDLFEETIVPFWDLLARGFPEGQRPPKRAADERTWAWWTMNTWQGHCLESVDWAAVWTYLAGTPGATFVFSRTACVADVRLHPSVPSMSIQLTAGARLLKDTQYAPNARPSVYAPYVTFTALLVHPFVAAFELGYALFGDNQWRCTDKRVTPHPAMDAVFGHIHRVGAW